MIYLPLSRTPLVLSPERVLTLVVLGLGWLCRTLWVYWRLIGTCPVSKRTSFQGLDMLGLYYPATIVSIPTVAAKCIDKNGITALWAQRKLKGGPKKLP